MQYKVAGALVAAAFFLSATASTSNGTTMTAPPPPSGTVVITNPNSDFDLFDSTFSQEPPPPPTTTAQPANSEPPTPQWPLGGGRLPAKQCALVFQWNKNLQKGNANYYKVRISLFDGAGIYLGDSVGTWPSTKTVNIKSKLPHEVIAEVPQAVATNGEVTYTYGALYNNEKSYPAVCSDTWTCYTRIMCDG